MNRKQPFQPFFGCDVWYSLWVPKDGTNGQEGRFEPRGPERVVEVKRNDSARGQGEVTHVKTMNSPCWITVDKVFNIRSGKLDRSAA